MVRGSQISSGPVWRLTEFVFVFAGYVNIDALDGDLPALRRLQALRLYRNYICRNVDGILSTGLREETYDVIITAGGFASDAINPLDVTEMLRVLRPGGHLLWTMKTAHDEEAVAFKSFDANLNGLGRAGRIKVGWLVVCLSCQS